MSGRRRSRSELPHAPLELVHPLSHPGARPPGGELLAELPAGVSVLALKLLRTVLAWSRDPLETAEALDASALRRLEQQALARFSADAPCAPLAVLAAQMTCPLEAEPGEVAKACMGVADWALSVSAGRTALAFAEAAALAWPRNARYAWLAGRLQRTHGQVRNAERWLRRAHRVAVWTDDFEGQARALIGLGNLFVERGNFLIARRVQGKALVLSRRRGFREYQAMALHDLFVISMELGAHVEADEYARRALDAYVPTPRRMAILAHDCAYHWLKQSLYHRALPVYRALLPHFDEPTDRLRVLANTAHAAAGCGEFDLFASCWDAAWQLTECEKHIPTLASALLAMASGAALAGDAGNASLAAGRALACAQSYGDASVAFLSEKLLREVGSGRSTPQRATPGADIRPVDQLVSSFVTRLTRVAMAS